MLPFNSRHTYYIAGQYLNDSDILAVFASHEVQQS